MKEIIIDYKGKSYKVKVSVEKNTAPDDVFKFEWEEEEGLKEFDSPVYIKRNKNGLSSPSYKNTDELDFFYSLSYSIFLNFENLPTGASVRL